MFGKIAIVLCSALFLSQVEGARRYQQPEKRKPKPSEAPAPRKLSYFGSADLLVWQADLEKFYTGMKMQTVVDSNLNVTGVNAKVENLDFKWDVGFRAGLGLHFGMHDDWTLSGVMTHIRNKASKEPTADFSDNTYLFPTPVSEGVQIFGVGGQGEKYRASWHATYNVFDLTMDRGFHLSSRFVLKPLLGLRGAWISQGYRESMLTTTTNANSIVSLQTTYSKIDASFNGVGLRMGFDALWELGSSFSIIGKLSGSFLRGEVENHYNIGIINPEFILAVTENIIPLKIKDESWGNRVNLDGAIGLSWNKKFKEGRYGLTLSGLYEMSHWFGLNQFSQFELISELNRGLLVSASTTFDLTQYPFSSDYSLQGFTFSATFDF